MTKRTAQIKELFLQHYPDSVTELHYNNLYELVVSVMLSAQCTDKRVNIITPALFARYPDTKALAQADIEDIKALIKSCSFFNNKAKNLLGFAQKIENEFGSAIPTTQKELVSLPGVGQKTANVVLIEYFEHNLMAVDTHVFRVSHRLGLSYAKTATQTESELAKKFETDLSRLHQAMVLFGRYICTALKPDCTGKCFLQQFCRSKKSYKV
ncbi:MAG: endonuclease III [Campylobacterota bacterium]